MPLPDALSPHIAWVLVASFLVALMQAGFTCLESGFVRAKNSIHVAIKNLVDFCISAVLFTLFGFAIMFGPTVDGLYGLPGLVAYETMTPQQVTFFIFQIMFCGTATTIIAGAVSERMRFVGYIAVTVVIAGVIYPLVGHWIWNGIDQGQANGWLGRMGFVDFAGSTVVHSVGGWVSLSAILIIGPRIGRFGPHGHRIEGHNLPMAVLGVFLLWFGFFGFNGGSTLALSGQVPVIVANTALSGAASGLAGMVVSWIISRRPGVDAIVNSTVAGLVAICASANLVGALDSLLIGAGAGIISVLGLHLLERLSIDDVIGAVPSHLFAGVWGTLAVALFASPADLPAGDRIGQLGVQAAGIAAVGLFSIVVSYVLFRIMDLMFSFRVDAQAERVGLNVAEHAASTSLLDLITQMDRQAQTGNFKSDVEVEPETEASRIATFYNAVLRKFRTETQRRQDALDRLAKLAATDTLTNLHNRRSFFESMRRAQAASQRNQRQGAILFLDLDGFKAVNDGMGHDAGDALLIQVAKRIVASVRENDMVARLGGDEFALLVDEIDSLDGLTALADKLVVTIREPFQLPQGIATIGASVGVAVFGGSKAQRESPEAIVQRADSAMYEAKLAGKGAWRLSEAPMSDAPPGTGKAAPEPPR